MVCRALLGQGHRVRLQFGRRHAACVPLLRSQRREKAATTGMGAGRSFQALPGPGPSGALVTLLYYNGTCNSSGLREMCQRVPETGEYGMGMTLEEGVLERRQEKTDLREQLAQRDELIAQV